MKLLRAGIALFALLASSMASSSPPPAMEAERLADLLVAAERQAAHPRQTRKLAETLAALEASGIAPAEGDPDPLPVWRARLPEGSIRPPMRGRTLGAAFRRGVINPGQKLEFRQGFLAGQLAEVAVATAGTGHFALEVIEDGGRTICRSRSAVRRASCRWVPDFSGASIVRLSNGDRAATGFVLVLR
jgi:hypothetical protein